MALVNIAPPLAEPVSLAEIKEFLRIDTGDTSNDGTLTALALSARFWTEVFIQRRVVSQTWRLLMDFFPGTVDERFVGQKISSPFVSGANALLTGIRFAFLVPFPPCQQIIDFTYQNANGQVSSMILGPLTISAVSNITAQPVGITTSTPHGLQNGASITFSGNAALSAVLASQAQLYATVVDPTNIVVNASVGTGSSISATGTMTGYNFIQDLSSNPARLTPLFGQFWPVARVVANAVQIDYVCGYGGPVTVGTTNGSPVIGTATFTASNVGQPIAIPGAGPNGSTLNTIIQSVSGGVGTMATLASATVSGATAVLNIPEGIKTGIKMLVAHWYETRVPGETNIPMAVKAVLGNFRDMRF